MYPVEPTGKRTEYAKDILIDWNALQVEVTARVVQTDLPIELLLCAENSKEHESILATGAQPRKIYEALGLIGATVGSPMSFDPTTGKQTTASGQPLDIEIEHESSGKKLRQKAHEWMVDSKNKKPIAPLDWRFCGSRMEGGTFTADADGTIACVVDFSTALIGLAASHSASDSELWVLADKNRVPMLGTTCTVIIRPKKDAATPPPAATVSTTTAPAAKSDNIDLLLTPEGFFQSGDEILDALSLDAMIKEQIKTNPDLKVSLTAMPVEPDAVEKMNLFTRLAGRAIIGSGINQKNLTMKLLDEPPKVASDANEPETSTPEKQQPKQEAPKEKTGAPEAASPSPAPADLGEIRRKAAEKKNPQASPAPSPSPSPEAKNP